MTDLRKLSIEQLTEALVSFGEKSFRASQVYDWIWAKNARSFEEMSNLSLELRKKLTSHFDINPAEIHQVQISKDGTIKNAVRLHDGFMVESVMIPTSERSTACVSSQVGCSLDCEFCATAKLKRMRNLEVAEIVDQVVLIHRQSLEFTGRPLSNIVFMGMGEPLMNFPNVVEAIRKISDPKALAMSPRRITVSTSGIPKMIMKLADEKLRVNLALSLHSAIEHKRNDIMPFSKAFSLEEIKNSLIYWHRETGSIITLEYCVWGGINDGKEDIEALLDFCQDVMVKVNIIQYNPIGEGKFARRNIDAEAQYIRALEKNNIPVTVRRSRGADIDAACGQLANKNL